MPPARKRASARSSDTALQEWRDVVDCKDENVATSDVIRDLLNAVLAAPSPAAAIQGREILIRNLAEGLELRARSGEDDVAALRERVCDIFSAIQEVRAVLFHRDGSWLVYTVAIEPWTRDARSSVVAGRIAIRDEFPALDIFFETVPAAEMETLGLNAHVVLLKESRPAA